MVSNMQLVSCVYFRCQITVYKGVYYKYNSTMYMNILLDIVLILQQVRLYRL